MFASSQRTVVGISPFLFYLKLFSNIFWAREVIGHACMDRPFGRNGCDAYISTCGSNYDVTPWTPQNQLAWEAIPQPDDPGTQCGVCGDFINATVPRIHDYGGLYGRRGPVSAYRQGQIIKTKVVVSNPHGGGISWRISADAKTSTDNQASFILLNITSLWYVSVPNTTAFTNPTKIRITTGQRPNADLYIGAEIQLPDFACDSCVLQFNYRTGGPGYKLLGIKGWKTFRTCSDIRIAPAEEPITRLRNVAIASCVETNTQSSPSLLLTNCSNNNLQQPVITTVPFQETSANSFRIIFSAGAGICLDVFGHSTNRGTEVGQYDCNGSENQIWQQILVGDHFLLQSNYSGYCMTARPNTANKFAISQDICNPKDPYQQWAFDQTTDFVKHPPKPSPPLRLRSQAFQAKTCIGANYSTTYSFELSACNASSQIVMGTQAWNVFETNYQQITIDPTSGNCIGVNNGGMRDGIEVGFYACKSQWQTQKWAIVPVNLVKGTFLLKNLYSDRCVETGTTQSVQFTCDTGNPNQLWTLFDAEHDVDISL